MIIPFLDLGSAYRELQQDIDAAVTRVLGSGLYILGPEVESFERGFSAYTGASYTIGVANGLDALHLGLRALDIGPGDEVVVPSNTFIATWLAVSQCGATPIPLEPTLGTSNIDVAKLEAVITPRTRAVIAVHLYGQPADLSPVLKIARNHGLRVIEDAAQAHGARYKGVRIGVHSDLVTWSFYPGKNLGALGDGGAITTNDSDLNYKLRTLRNYGAHRKYVHETQGFNSRLDPLQAAILKVKLNHLDEWNARRVAIADFYLNAITNSQVSLPEVPDWAEPVWHLFVIRHPDRDTLQASLLQEGVQTQIHYPIPPHKQNAYSTDFSDANYPIAETLSKTVLSLPIGPHFSMQQARRVAELVNRLA
jgi:dTDP-4-amino-4,6-dideoxygalactose transaminase